jgi:hypothetical protein
LRPHHYLVRRGIVAALALILPVFAVIYWFTIPSGGWLVTTVIFLLVVAIACIAVFSVFRTSIQVDDNGLQIRGPFGRTRRIRHEDVGSLELVELYQPSTLETEPHLYVVGKNGRPLVRMRGGLWPVDSMNRVASALDAPVRVESHPLTLSEFGVAKPELLTLFQRVVTRTH